MGHVALIFRMRDNIRLFKPLCVQAKEASNSIEWEGRGQWHIERPTCDLEIKFKLLIVFNTLLCPAKHLNYLLLGFHFTFNAEKGFESERAKCCFIGHSMGRYSTPYSQKDSVYIDVEQIFHSINNDLYVECK